MKIQVLAFARLRELLARADPTLELPDGARVRDAWKALAERHPGMEDLRASTRIACNGALVSAEQQLHAGDELALLPPVGGG